jgi:hypothetical protein
MHSIFRADKLCLRNGVGIFPIYTGAERVAEYPIADAEPLLPRNAYTPVMRRFFFFIYFSFQ